MRTIVLAVLIAFVHLGLAISYCQETPYRTPGRLMGQRDAMHQPIPASDIGAPDERQHANYVQHLMDGKGFPVFSHDSPDYESHQPPAYYLLSAGFSKVVGVHDVDTPDGIRLRWLNALIGAITILGVFHLALWGYGRTDVALGAAVFAALLPMLCAVDGAISNDPLLFCLLTWTMALLAKAATRGWNWKLAAGIGVLTGLSLLTKTTALALVPTLVVAAFLGKKPPFRTIIGVFGLAVGIALPWWLRNKQLYGDFLAMSAFTSGFGNPRPQDIIPGLSGGAFEYWTSWFGWWSIRSFFGAFGYMDIFLNSTGVPMPSAKSGDTEILYRFLLLGSLALSAGCLLAFQKPEWKEQKAVTVLNGVFLALILLLFIRFNLTYFQAQGRYVIPAIGPIACGMAIGISHWSKQNWKLGISTMALILVGVNVYALMRLPGEFAKRTNVGEHSFRSNVGARLKVVS